MRLRQNILALAADQRERVLSFRAESLEAGRQGHKAYESRLRGKADATNYCHRELLNAVEEDDLAEADRLTAAATIIRELTSQPGWTPEQLAEALCSSDQI